MGILVSKVGSCSSENKMKGGMMLIRKAVMESALGQPIPLIRRGRPFLFHHFE